MYGEGLPEGLSGRRVIEDPSESQASGVGKGGGGSAGEVSGGEEGAAEEGVERSVMVQGKGSGSDRDR